MSKNKKDKRKQSQNDSIKEVTQKKIKANSFSDMLRKRAMEKKERVKRLNKSNDGQTES